MIAGILVGLAVLAVMVVASVVVPKIDEENEPAPLSLTLPDTLPGGYAAADLPESFEGGDLAAQADAIAQQQADSTAYGNEVLPDALDTAAVTRSYVVNGNRAVFVQVFQAEGGAFSPSSLTDPETTDGAGGVTMRAVDDGVCILTIGQMQPGQPGAEVQTSSECQVTRDGVTVQVSADQVPAGDLVELADQVFELAVEA